MRQKTVQKVMLVIKMKWMVKMTVTVKTSDICSSPDPDILILISEVGSGAIWHMKALTTPRDLLSLRLHQCHKHPLYILIPFPWSAFSLNVGIKNCTWFLTVIWTVGIYLYILDMSHSLYIGLFILVLHGDIVYESQYCILNKSLSLQFWSCQSNLMGRGGLLRGSLF